jgi:hypothetical protein
VRRFHQLAAMSDEQIASIIKPAGFQRPNFDLWIRQASQMGSESYQNERVSSKR